MTTTEDDSFKKFTYVCYGLAAICAICALWINFMGIPNFENVDGMREFCLEYGGDPIEKHRSNHNQFLCGFQTDKGYFKFAPHQLEENGAEFYNLTTDDYCFTCWDTEACASGHGAYLRVKTGCDYR